MGEFMAIEQGKIDGDLQVSDSYVLQGMVTGNVFVLSGGHLTLQGMCGRDLVVNEGGVALVEGTVLGNVRNQGGTLQVSGVVSGQLISSHGQTQVVPGAVVNGVQA